MRFAHTCDITRMVPIGTNGRTSLTSSQPLYTGVPCTILPMSTRTTIENKFSIGKAYNGFFKPAQDIRNGDQVSWQGLTLYVRYIKPYVGLGRTSHLEVMFEQEIA